MIKLVATDMDGTFLRGHGKRATKREGSISRTDRG